MLKNRQFTFHDVILARYLAYMYHNDQTYNGFHYIVHLDDVAAFVANKWGAHNYQLQVIAYLHDILEDTTIDKRLIRRLFSAHVLRCIENVTDEKANNRKERKKLTNLKLRGLDSSYFLDSLRIKLGDRFCNVKSSYLNNNKLFLMYKQEHGEFRAAVERAFIDQEIWQELENLIQSN